MPDAIQQQPQWRGEPPRPGTAEIRFHSPVRCSKSAESLRNRLLPPIEIALRNDDTSSRRRTRERARRAFDGPSQGIRLLEVFETRGLQIFRREDHRVAGKGSKGPPAGHDGIGFIE
jgi:hypothetical protein